MYDVARNMMQRLRPAVLDEFGLLKALQEMIDKWNDHHEEVFCHFKCNAEIDSLNEEIAINLFRIVQEGLTNVARHAGATDVNISIETEIGAGDTELLRLTIQDNGRGFPVDEISVGMGLLGMRERVEAMNGNFQINSRQAGGTYLVITVPVVPRDTGSSEL